MTQPEGQAEEQAAAGSDAASPSSAAPEQVKTSNLASVLESKGAQPAASLREDLVSSAVAFLSNPKVSGSPEAPKRAFLLKKGLTDEEIDEAVHRAAVFVPSSDSSAAPPASSPAPTPDPVQPQLQNPVSTQVQPSFFRAAAHTALVSCAVYGALATLTPLVKRCWNHFWPGSSEESRTEARLLQLLAQSEERQKQALQDMLHEAMDRVSTSVQQVQDRSEVSIQGVHTTVQSLKNEFLRLNGSMQQASGSPPPGRKDLGSDAYRAPLDLTTSYYSGSSGPVRSAQPNGIHASAAANGFPAYAAAFPGHSAGTSAAAPRADSAASEDSASQSDAQKPAGYLQILQMLERGELPAGVRTDIVDQPRFPNMQPTPSALARQPKPWQRDTPSQGSADDAADPPRFAAPVAAGSASPGMGFGNAAPTGAEEATAIIGGRQAAGADASPASTADVRKQLDSPSGGERAAADASVEAAGCNVRSRPVVVEADSLDVEDVE